MLKTFIKEHKVHASILLGVVLSVALALVTHLSNKLTTIEKKQVLGFIDSTGENIQRKSLDDKEFKNISEVSNLYHQDQIVVGIDSKSKLRLPSGEFWLDPGTAVTVVMDFNEKSSDPKNPPRIRLQLVQGELSFHRKISDPVLAATQGEVVVQIAEDTLIAVSTYANIAIKKEASGEYMVVDADAPVVGHVYTYSKPDNNLSIAQIHLFPHELPASLAEAQVDSATEVIVPKKIRKKSSKKPRVLASTDAAISMSPPAPESNGGRWDISPYYSMSLLGALDNATGTNSKLSTQYNIGIRLKYITEWSDSFKTFMSVKLGMVNFEKPTENTKAIQDASKFMSGIGLGTNHKLSEKLNLQLSADYQKELFLQGVSTQIVAVDAINIPSIGMKASYDMYQHKMMTLGLAGEMSGKFGASGGSYDVNFGTEFGGSMYFREKNASGTSKFQTELSLLHRQQNTSIAKQSETSVLLGMRFFFPSSEQEK